MGSNNQESSDCLSRFEAVGLHEGLAQEGAGEISGANGRLDRISFSGRTCLAALLTAASYYVGARIGMGLTFEPHAVSVLWPPNSILLAVLVLSPLRIWWVLALAAFPAHLAAELSHGVPLSMVIPWFVSNCFEAFIGAGTIRFLLPNPLRLDSLTNTWTFFACGALLAPFLSSFLDVAFVVLNRFGSDTYWYMWRMRFVSNVMSELTFAPLIVSVGGLDWNAVRGVNRKRVVEGVLLAVGLCAVTVSAFCQPAVGTWATPVFLYAPLPFLLWAAVRFGPSASSAGIIGVALLVIWGAVHRRGPFSSTMPEQSALSMQLFFIMISITLLSLAVALRERRHIAQALQQSEEQYREVVDSQTDLICRYTADTTLTFVNESYCKFFKMPRERLLGRRFLELIPSFAREGVVRKIEAMSRDCACAKLEHEVCLPDGTIGWHSWIDHPVLGDDGQIVEFQGIGRDVTDRRRAEEAQQNLAHTSRLVVVGELTAMVAHEISQPLAAILSNTEAAEMLLQSTKPDLQEVRQILADIRKDDLRASETIRRIWALLRKRQTEVSSVDVNEMVSDVLHLVSGDALQRRVQIERELTSGEPFVSADKVQLQQVLLNLIINGMDAMSDMAEERKLTIRTAVVDARRVEISVVDNGPGIPTDKISHIFDLFFTTKPHGMGLGLAIARSIIESHGGQLLAENNRSGGATFRCQLPSL